MPFSGTRIEWKTACEMHTGQRACSGKEQSALKTRCNRDKMHAHLLRIRDSALRRIQTLGFHVIGIGYRETLRHSFVVLFHLCVLLHRGVQLNWLAWIERLQIQQLAAIRDVQVPNQHSTTYLHTPISVFRNLH